ncbi:hypothetical protein C5167_011681 [Papaver somniferum]|uniref:Uncharacterized protein n=1 Tax=Papaver somniferum TaxID=3469 RepID=A0A4Y7K4Y5_PAPSO|nr:hypothetical protein C5167_011681 [Papaver somniferum]
MVAFHDVRLALLSASSSTSFSSDAFVEMKPGEIGIRQEHLHRRVVIYYSPARSANQQGSEEVGK